MAQLKLEPLEASTEKVNKVIVFGRKNEGNNDCIQLYLILSYQKHFDIEKTGESYVFISTYVIKLAYEI